MSQNRVCLTKEDLFIANDILNEVLAETGESVNHFNKTLEKLTTVKDINGNQEGGWDAFEIMAKLIISGTISATVFGFYKASGWILYYLTNCYEVQAGVEICMSTAVLPGIVYFLKEETKKIGHLAYNTPERQRVLAQKLRETYGTIDNFLQSIDEEMWLG